MSTPVPAGPSGRAAEDAAAEFLRGQGYALLARNFSTPVGEVDIIAADGGTICFVEVRSLRSGAFAPHETVTPRKQKRIRAAARRYLSERRLGDALCRFDVVSLVPTPGRASGWEIELLRDAF